jgi:hypothetical protein
MSMNLMNLHNLFEHLKLAASYECVYILLFSLFVYLSLDGSPGASLTMEAALNVAEAAYQLT